MPSQGPFTRRALHELLRDSDRVTAAVTGLVTGTARIVHLPPLPIGSQMLPYFDLHQLPEGSDWRETQYEAVTPWVCTVRDALVHSDAGIVVTQGSIIADTLGQTDPTKHHYRIAGDGVHLLGRDPLSHVAGTALSLLTFGAHNYYHWTIDGIGRLAALDDATREACSHVLIPDRLPPAHRAILAHTGLADQCTIVPVAADETLRVDRLVTPWTMTGDTRPHPALRSLFARPPFPSRTQVPSETPTRIYVDRRASINRRLTNEAEVIAALARFGIAPIRLETLPLDEQIALFANAELVVAPHGAGLANLVYARPGLRVIELHMDVYTTWIVRRLAALFDVDYDCVIGRAHPGTAGSVHARHWTISVTHVEAAVAHALTRRTFPPIALLRPVPTLF